MVVSRIRGRGKEMGEEKEKWREEIGKDENKIGRQRKRWRKERLRRESVKRKMRWEGK